MATFDVSYEVQSRGGVRLPESATAPSDRLGEKISALGEGIRRLNGVQSVTRNVQWIRGEDGEVEAATVEYTLKNELYRGCWSVEGVCRLTVW